MGLNQFWIEWLAVFILNGLSNVGYALWARRCSQGRPLGAALYCLLLSSSYAGAAFFFVRNPWFIIPQGLSAFLFTGLTVWWDSRRASRTEMITP